MRAFSSSPGNELFDGGIGFALGLHLEGENWDRKKFGILTANFFSHPNDFLL